MARRQLAVAAVEVAAAVRGPRARQVPGSGVDVDVDVDMDVDVDDAGAQQIVFNTMKCSLSGKVFANIECRPETREALSLILTTNELKTADNVVGVFELRLSIYGQTKTITMKKIRLDLCQLRAQRYKKSLMRLFYKGLRTANHNLPDKCPFLRNTTYFMRKVEIDASELPPYLPEYNITFGGRIYANNVLSSELRITGGFCEAEQDCTGQREL
ncbi:GL17756 [Drosophila persimilis]|uniref:GL17756 n=1 Tax=Drosophila persimilis TaxID=7234 RepID=B4GIP9_DROPE|nr:GL17756 [Drosophila persimilis]